MNLVFDTASGSHYELDVKAGTLTRSHPHNNIVRASEPDLPPFEGPSWKIRTGLVFPTGHGSLQGVFYVEGRDDPLVTTGIVQMGSVA